MSNKNDKLQVMEYNLYLENQIEKLINNYFVPLKQYGNLDNIDYSSELEKLKIELNDYYIQNRKLAQELVKSNQIIQAQNSYIFYLLNSYWWKLTWPFRFISRTVKRQYYLKLNKVNKVDLLPKIDLLNQPATMNLKVSIIISVRDYNENLSVQINEFFEQKLLGEIEILIVDFSNDDKTKKMAEWYKVKYLDIINNEEILNNFYDTCLKYISGDYVVYINEGINICDKNWLYKSIKPIEDGNTIMTGFLRKNINRILKEIYYIEFKERINKIEKYSMIYFPMHRDSIQYITPELLEYCEIIVLKNTRSLFYK